VNASARGQLAAVGSRRLESAQAFAGTYHIPRSCGDYESVLTTSEVDAVYVSLPNSLHHQWTLAALAAGKHVLCEKPFSVTAAEAEEMFDAARRAGRVVMEAFMYRCHPLTHAVQAAVAGGAVGRVKLIRTSFCFRTTRVADNVRFRPDLGGGAMMDVGCYCLSFTRLFANTLGTGRWFDTYIPNLVPVGGTIPQLTGGLPAMPGPLSRPAAGGGAK